MKDFDEMKNKTILNSLLTDCDDSWEWNQLNTNMNKESIQLKGYDGKSCGKKISPLKFKIKK